MNPTNSNLHIGDLWEFDINDDQNAIQKNAKELSEKIAENPSSVSPQPCTHVKGDDLWEDPKDNTYYGLRVVSAEAA